MSVIFTHVTHSMLDQVIALLPTVEFDTAWMDEAGDYSNLANQPISDLPEGLVHTCVSPTNRRLFIVNHKGVAHLIYSVNYITYIPQRESDEIRLQYAGSEELADVLGLSTERLVGLEGLANWFAFFGPESVDALIKRWVTDAHAGSFEFADTITPSQLDAEMASLSQAVDVVLDIVVPAEQISVEGAVAYNRITLEQLDAKVDEYLQSKGYDRGSLTDHDVQKIQGKIIAEGKYVVVQSPERQARFDAKVDAVNAPKEEAPVEVKPQVPFIEKYTTEEGKKGLRVNANTNGRKFLVGAVIGGVAGLATVGLVRLFR